MVNPKDNKIKLISVIVPVYNVDEYLEDCIDSIINQTYKELEIILVDDGSTDSSNAICKKYEQMDSRVILLEKENGGLSDARNYGLASCKGDCFSFVDSDDIIPENYFEKLVHSMLEYNTEIVLCDFVRMVGDKIENGDLSINGEISNREGVIACFKGTLVHSACAKLFSSKIKDKLVFPVGRYFEDQFVIYDVLVDRKLSVTSETQYIYRKREGSITQDIKKAEKRDVDLLDSLDHVVEIVSNKFNDMDEFVQYKILEDCLVIIKNDIKANKSDDTTRMAIDKIRGLKANMLKKAGVTKSFYIQYLLISVNYKLYIHIFNKMLRKGLNREA